VCVCVRACCELLICTTLIQTMAGEGARGTEGEREKMRRERARVSECVTEREKESEGVCVYKSK